MLNQCSSCGFSGNPIDANCCGKCGKSINQTWREIYYNKTGKDRWKVYDSQSYIVLTKERYDSLIEAERLSKLSIWEKVSKEIEFYWKKYSDLDNWNTTFTAIFWVVIILLVIAFIAIFFPTSCNTKKISRIEVNGKYGIGYNEEKLIVPAKYDTISPTGNGNQWLLYDKSTSNFGIAYVTDSVVNVLDPQTLKAKAIKRNANGYSQIRLDGTNMYEEGKYIIITKGLHNNKTEYKRLKYPGYNDNNCIVAKLSDDGMQMLGNDGMPIDGKTYFNIVIDSDSMIRAIYYDKTDTKRKSYTTTTIHDYTGKQTSPKEFYGVNEFSDGVAWACLTAQDRENYSHSLIDRNGNVLFKNKPNAINCIGFGDGIGWYSKSYYSKDFTAVDKKGNDLFQIEAQNVYPFTMGLGPVFKGTSSSNMKLGFVDKTGKTVIPFKYKSQYNNPHFGPDSLMVGISLNGVEGKLHRNGTFIPN